MGKKNDARLAIAHIKTLIANHDAKYLCTVQRNKEELLEHTNCPIEGTQAVYPLNILDIEYVYIVLMWKAPS